MNLEIDGQKWRVSFNHRLFLDSAGKPQPQKNPMTNRKLARGYTQAIVYGPQFVGEGLSFCSMDDQFNKQRGRKEALARALFRLDKATRRAVWDAYHAKRVAQLNQHLQLPPTLWTEASPADVRCS